MKILVFGCDWVQYNTSTSETVWLNTNTDLVHLCRRCCQVPFLHLLGAPPVLRLGGWGLAPTIVNMGQGGSVYTHLPSQLYPTTLPMITNWELNCWPFNNSGTFDLDPFTREWGLRKYHWEQDPWRSYPVSIPHTHNSQPYSRCSTDTHNMNQLFSLIMGMLN